MSCCILSESRTSPLQYIVSFKATKEEKWMVKEANTLD